MEWYVKAFIKASLVWLGLGVALGIAMAVHPPWTLYRTAHLHMNFAGFVAMLIFGVSYHVMPRFTGSPLRNGKLALAHWWAANVGLALLALGFMTRLTLGGAATAAIVTGGLLWGLGAYAFIGNIWLTISARPRPAGPQVVPLDAGGLKRRGSQ